MLVIRPDQIRIFSKYLVDQFRERMVQEIAERHPKRFAELGKPGALALIDRILKDALPNGIRQDGDLRALLDSFLQAGPKTEEQLAQPWARKILSAASLPGSVKVRLLSSALIAHLAPPAKRVWEPI